MDDILNVLGALAGHTADHFAQNGHDILKAVELGAAGAAGEIALKEAHKAWTEGQQNNLANGTVNGSQSLRQRPAN